MLDITRSYDKMNSLSLSRHLIKRGVFITPIGNEFRRDFLLFEVVTPFLLLWFCIYREIVLLNIYL